MCLTDLLAGCPWVYSCNEKGYSYIMKLVVKAACIANWLAILISSPKSCCRCLAVRTASTLSSRGRLKNTSYKYHQWKIYGTYKSSFGLDKRPILAVHLVVEAAGITEVMSIPISSPEGSWSRPTIYAFTSLCKFKTSVFAVRTEPSLTGILM